MKVICINSKNTKLVQDKIYGAKEICGRNINQKNGLSSYERILLKNGDIYYNLSRFTTLNGGKLDDVNYTLDEEFEDLIICTDNVEVSEIIGNFVRCTKGAGTKYFIKDKYYKVEDIKLSWYNYLIKIEGYDYCTANRFRMLSKRENRDIKIDILNGGNPFIKKFDRKFDILSDDEKTHVIIQKLTIARKEMVKNNFKDVSLCDYIIRTDKEFGICKEDIEKIKNKKIVDLFTL